MLILEISWLNILGSELVCVCTRVCVNMCVLCVGIHACGGQRLIMSFFLYHVSVFISGD